jgi:hypothetical protein
LRGGLGSGRASWRRRPRCARRCRPRRRAQAQVRNPRYPFCASLATKRPPRSRRLLVHILRFTCLYRFPYGTNTMGRPEHDTKNTVQAWQSPVVMPCLGRNFGPQCRHGHNTANRLARCWPNYFYHLML